MRYSFLPKGFEEVCKKLQMLGKEDIDEVRRLSTTTALSLEGAMRLLRDLRQAEYQFLSYRKKIRTKQRSASTRKRARMMKR